LKVDRISPLDFAVKRQQNFKAPKGQSDPWSGLLDMGFCGSVLPPLKLSLAGCTTPCGPSRASSFKPPELFVVASPSTESPADFFAKIKLAVNAPRFCSETETTG
jgi:hypothetical protein